MFVLDMLLLGSFSPTLTKVESLTFLIENSVTTRYQDVLKYTHMRDGIIWLADST